MVRIADAILPHGTPGELIEVLEAIIAVINTGRYQIRGLNATPTEDAGDGETAFHVIDSENKKLYIYDKTNQIWEEVVLARNILSTEPTGTIKMWAGDLTTPPTGYLTCDGSEVSRADYSDLFEVVSTAFGAGNGSSTFNLPNFTNCFPYGASAGADPGNAQVGSRKLRDSELSGNDSSVTMPFRTVASFTGGGAGLAPNPSNQDLMAPYVAVGFIIKT